MEGVITELVFEHALRIRMKGDSSTSPASPGTETAVASPGSSADTTSPLQDASSTIGDTDGVETIIADSAAPPESQITTAIDVAAAVASSKALKDNKASEKDGDATDNLVGKINNLITSDLQNIVELPEIPSVLFYTPLKLVLSIWFLYTLLGWR